MSITNRMEPLLFSHVDHDLTRPTLLVGPDGCGKTQYARRCLKRFSVIELTCMPAGELLDQMQTMMQGGGIKALRKRALLVVDVHLLMKDRGVNWVKFGGLCKQLSARGLPVIAVADWGSLARRLPADTKRHFYAVEVGPPTPAQICDILRRQSQLPARELDRIAYACNGDVRQAINMAGSGTGLSQKDMFKDSEVDERLAVVFGKRVDDYEHLLDLGMLPRMFDNYTQQPLPHANIWRAAELFSLADAYLAKVPPSELQESNFPRLTCVPPIVRQLRAPSGRYVVGARECNKMALAGSNRKAWLKERNKMLGRTVNVDLTYTSVLCKLPNPYPDVNIDRLRHKLGKKTAKQS